MDDLKPFEYDYAGPEEQIFDLADYGMDPKDEIVRFRINYNGENNIVCSYYMGIWGDP